MENLFYDEINPAALLQSSPAEGGKMLVSTVERINTIEKAIEAEHQIRQSFQPAMDSRVEYYLANLTLNTPWGDRQAAAKNLGNLRDPAAIPGLVAALQADNFWMVRCAIIQALEKISDPRAIPFLILVSQQDSFQVVRSYAAKAVQMLSRL